MLIYVKKFALEILPSVAATVIGAYIVNHYISRPTPDAPVAAVVSPADARKNAAKSIDASMPEPGVTAKGISERAMIEKAASEKPAEFKPTETKPTETKSADAKPTEARISDTKPAETASDRRHAAPAAHEKAVAKAAPSPGEVAAIPAAAEEHRDANDLARAAIERLRGADSQPRTQEASRTPDAPHLQDAPKTVSPPPAVAAIRPLPPPITVSSPPVESSPSAAPYTASIQNDPNRPIPPADIPGPPPPGPLDLQANATKLATRTNNMAQDMLSAAKSMFHAVLPNTNRQNNADSNTNQFTD